MRNRSRAEGPSGSLLSDTGICNVFGTCCCRNDTGFDHSGSMERMRTQGSSRRPEHAKAGAPVEQIVSPVRGALAKGHTRGFASVRSGAVIWWNDTLRRNGGDGVSDRLAWTMKGLDAAGRCRVVRQSPKHSSGCGTFGRTSRLVGHGAHRDARGDRGASRGRFMHVWQKVMANCDGAFVGHVRPASKDVG